MTAYDKRNKLASRAAMVLGNEEAQTLMDMISTGERLELQLTKYRAELDQKFAYIDQRFAQIDQRFAQIDQRFAEVDATLHGRFARHDRRNRSGLAGRGRGAGSHAPVLGQRRNSTHK